MKYEQNLLTQTAHKLLVRSHPTNFMSENPLTSPRSAPPMIKSTRELDRSAIQILRENEWGDYTLPTRGLYPYQWNWDSMFVSLGFAEIDLDRGWREVESLFEGQWANGMAAHIVFRRDDPSYFPGPKVWGGTHSLATSGLSQPPVAASVVRDLYERDPGLGLERLKAIFPRLMAWHRWFHTMRVVSGGAAIAVTHPWESGRDNSPDWDEALGNVDPAGVTPYERRDLNHVDPSMRPTNAQYDRYIKLVEYGRETGWDHAQITREGPFAVADPGITFILMRADRDLLALATILGIKGAEHELDKWLWKRRQAADLLWNEAQGAYLARDMRSMKSSEGISSVAFLSFYAGLSDPDRDPALLANLHRMIEATKYSIASFDPEHPKFDSRRYWRGPAWAIINYLVARGLKEQGYTDLASKIRMDTREMIRQAGFFEYFDPTDGKGSGGDNFTWTAAIWLAWASPTVGE
jgi:hypothetical protein